MSAVQIVLWLPLKLWKFAVYVWTTIQSHQFPIWMTICGAVVGAAVTWYGVPGINQQLEFQRMRASYLTKALDDLNSTASEYIGYVTQIMALADGDTPPPQLVGDEARSAAQLLWQANDLRIVLKNRGEETVREFQIALIELRKQAKAKPSNDDVKFEEAVLTFLDAAHSLSSTLADFAQLRP